MFKNYFKTAFRSLSRNKNYTIINIAGLAVGIAVCMMIFMIIQYQTSFDTFHPKKDRIYRVLTESHHANAGTVTYEKNVPFLDARRIESGISPVGTSGACLCKPQ